MGRFNIPCVTIIPFSGGGLIPTARNGPDGFVPSELAWFEKIGGGVRILVSPVQHNPMTKETRYYPTLEVRLTYGWATP